jgi:DNA polymerase V
LEQEPPAKQQIACTRSFGQSVLTLHELQQAVTEFASRAAQKARLQNSHAAQVLVFIRTSPFRAQDLQYSGSTVVPLRRSSNDTRDITNAALMGLERIFRQGYRYAKAGVMLLDLQPAGLTQQDLLLGDAIVEGRGDAAARRLMHALDTVNQRFGKGTLTMASAGLENEQRMWSMKQEHLTPGYTTDWEGLALVRA